MASAPRLTREYLEQVVAAVRGRMCPVRAKPGQCEPVSDAIVRRLRRDGFKDAQTVCGTIEPGTMGADPHVAAIERRRPPWRRLEEWLGGYYGHEWVWVGGERGWFVDATFDQFPGTADLPVRIWRSHPRDH
jgi:hypothetical protein